MLTPASEGTAGARRRLKEILAEHPEYFYVGQHVNPSNPKAHYRTTGPEIWADTDGRVDVLVAALGTGGTICGAGRYLKEQKPACAWSPSSRPSRPPSRRASFGPHRMMGTAPGFVPETLDRALIDEIVLVSEAEAFAMCRRIAREEGLLVGISSGATAHAALEIAQQCGRRPGRRLHLGRHRPALPERGGAFLRPSMADVVRLRASWDQQRRSFMIDATWMAAILDSLKDPVLFADTEHVTRYMNKAAIAHYEEGE